MSDRKKNARPVGSATGQAEETGITTNETNISDSECITSEDQRQTRLVSDILPHGKENAIPGRDLMPVLKLKDLRELTILVERERKYGFPICASTSCEKGYYLASDADELEDYIKSLGRRIHNVSRTMTHLEDTLDRMTGQEKIGR